MIHKTKKAKWKICHNAGQINVYVIALPANPANLLDIIPSWELLQKSYPKKHLYIIGLAKGYEEAITLAGSIVAEVYRHTGAFEVTKYLLEKKREREMA